MGWLAYVDTEEHPATRFLGTTWIKLEDVFIKATSGSNASGQTGGSNTKTISKANLPAVKVQVDSFALTNAKHGHTYPVGGGSHNYSSYGNCEGYPGGRSSTTNVNLGGGTNTGTASPFTETLGSGTPLDITPSFYTVHIWKRLS